MRSKLAIALPMTFLLLFVSTLGIVAFTYYFAVERVNTQGQTLKVTTAKQDLVSLDNSLTSTSWQPGSSSRADISDSGGKLNIQPTTNNLKLNVAYNDGSQVNDNIFNSNIGQVTYELPYVDNSDFGLYLKGDSQSITNQSGASMTQLGIRNGPEHAEIFLSYRPKVTYAISGIEDQRAINNIRISIVNLNASDAISLYGKLPLKISCQSVQSETTIYTPASTINSLLVTSTLSEDTNTISIPIASSTGGSTINVELVISYIKIERATV